MLKLTVVSTESQACSELGIDRSTPTKWKTQNPDFGVACVRAKEARLAMEAQAITVAEEEAKKTVAAILPTAAKQLAKIISMPLENCSDRAKATLLRACETALKGKGIFDVPTTQRRFVTSSRKLDFTRLVLETDKRGGEAIAEAAKEIEEAGLSDTISKILTEGKED